MHSPYMYDLLTQVFDDQKLYYVFETIEEAREEISHSDRLIMNLDLGAGSHKAHGASRTVAQIAGSAVSSPRKCEVLFRLAEQLQPKVTIELGSSLGISSAYLAAAYTDGRVYSFDGNPDLIRTAREFCADLKLNNIVFTDGNFDDTLPVQLESLPEIDLAYLDGNHRKEPTIKYYEMLRSKRAQNAVFVLDDIRWTREMFETWKEIKKDDTVRATVDAFSFGILFFSPNFKERLDLTITPERMSGGPILW
jgi:predicted O-methyltransferase YrrM